MSTTFQGDKVLDVLEALEEATRTPNVHLVDLKEVLDKENWSVYHNVDWNLFTPGKQGQIPDADSISCLMASAFEIDAMVSILHTLSVIALKFQKKLKQCQEHVASKLSRGIESLPNELLPLIFKFAVLDEERKGARQAVWLSHVSRRFREAALESPDLWTTLRFGASKNELDVFISRSGANPEFRVFIHVGRDFHPFDLDAFVVKCRPVASHLKKLTLTEEIQRSYFTTGDEEPMRYSVEAGLKSLHSYAQRGMQFPWLQELSIQGDNKDYICNPSGLTLSWTSPNLQSLQCSYYTPSPSIVFSSVTTFTFTQSIPAFDSDYVRRINPVLAFLPSLPNVSHFELELYFEDAHGKPIQLPEAACPSITSFQLRLRGFELSCGRGQERLVASLLQALRFPLLEELSIHIGFRDMYIGENESECTKLLADLSCALLPGQVSVPSARLSTLSYKAWYNDGPPRYATARTLPKEFPRVFTIPLEKIPTVSTLTLTTCTGVVFARESGSEVNDASEPRGLREIKFVACESMEKEDLHLSVQSLKDADVWNSLERVVVEDCYRLEYENVLAEVGEERLYFSH